MTHRDAAALACRMTALIILAWAVTYLIPEMIGPEHWRPVLAQTGMMAGIGIWLMFGSRGVARLVLWARSARPAFAGGSRSEPADQAPSQSMHPGA